MFVFSLLGICQERNSWLRQGYATSILELGTGFRVPANFCFSVDDTYSPAMLTVV